MMHGLDTSFLTAFELAEHGEHASARATVARLIAAGDSLALAPQVLVEFLHIVTDSKRFGQPLNIDEARRVSEVWWKATDVQHVFADDAAVLQFLTWIQQHNLGRKRLLDTLLAATYRRSGINSILTLNAADFAVFGGFVCVTPSVTP